MFFYGVTALAFALIGLRLYFLQHSHQPRLAELAQRQQKKTIIQLPNRGNIYDRNGEKLATSIDVTSIALDPKAKRLKKSEVAKLAQILELSAGIVKKRLALLHVIIMRWRKLLTGISSVTRCVAQAVSAALLLVLSG